MALQTFHVTYKATGAVPDRGPTSLALEPERVPARGFVTFTPSVDVLLEDDATPEDVYVVQQTYGLDETGELVDGAGNPTVALISPWSADLSVQGWNWIAKFDLRGGLKRPDVIIPAGDCQPGATVNLTKVAPVTAVGNTPVLKGPAGVPGPPGQHLLNHVVHLDDTTAPRPDTDFPVFWYGWVQPNELDESKNDVWIYVAEEGDGGSADADTAALISDVASATYAAMAAKFVPVSALWINPVAPTSPVTGQVWIKNG